MNTASASLTEANAASAWSARVALSPEPVRPGGRDSEIGGVGEPVGTDGSSPLVRQVLYVEDQPINAMIMQALFEQRRHLHLVVAEDGAHAQSLAPLLRPALLLLDLRLPDCSGIDLLPLLRRRFHWGHVKAIAVTAEAEFQALGTDFHEVWHKPLDLGRVLTRLDELLPPPAAGAGPAHRRAMAAATHGD